MSVNQKLVNVVTIVIFVYCLHLINREAAQISKEHDKYISLMKLIGNSKSLDQQTLETIKQIGKLEVNQTNEQSPLCFIKAFNQIVNKNPTNTKDLFTLFQDPYAEYLKITNCSQYLSLLLYKAGKLDENEREIVVKALNEIQSDIIQKKYSKSSSTPQKICLYFNAFNNFDTITDQVNALIAANSQYPTSKIVIENDGSTDKSFVWVNQAMKNAGSNIVSQRNIQRQGVLKGVQKFLATSCDDDSIVVLMQENQFVLGSNALWVLERIFSAHQADLIFFGTFTTQHLSIENIKSKKQLASQVNPFFAFRKSLAQGIDYTNKDFEGLERNYLAARLVQQASKKGVSIKIIDEAIIYRSENNNLALRQKLQKLMPSVYEN